MYFVLWLYDRQQVLRVSLYELLFKCGLTIPRLSYANLTHILDLFSKDHQTCILLQPIVLSESLEIWLGQKTLQLAGACFCKKSSLFNTYVGAGGCSPTFAWWAAALSWAGIWVFRLEQPGMGASQPWYFPIARHNFTLDLQISNVSLHWLPADESELTHVKFKTAVGFSELCQARDSGLCKSRQVQNLIESLTFKSLLKTHNITLKLKFDFCFFKVFHLMLTGSIA